MSLISKAAKEHILSRKELVEVLSGGFDDELFSAADEVRREFVGDEIHLRALIEFSNACARGCLYCGLRAGNRKLERYSLEGGEILDFTRKAVSEGYKTVVLQSGEGVYPNSKLVNVVCEIKKLGVDVTLSAGEKTFEEYALLKEAGADRYLLRIETTDRGLYKRLHPPVGELASHTEPGPRRGHPDMPFENRVRCLKDIRELGYEVGTGSLVGLPEQTLESLADDLLFFKELDADMIGIGPFIPNPDTPLGSAEGGSFTLALRMMSLTRLLLPDINIPATTAMETLEPNGRLIALQSGANVVMPNVTGDDYRRKYEIYPNKVSAGGNIREQIAAIGRRVADTVGKSKRFISRKA